MIILSVYKSNLNIYWSILQALPKWVYTFRVLPFSELLQGQVPVVVIVQESWL